MKKCIIKKRTNKLIELAYNILTLIKYIIMLLGLFFVLILLLLLYLRVERFMEYIDLIETEMECKLLSNHLRDYIFLSSLTGDDFGVGHLDIVSDTGRKLSTDPMDWGFTFDYKFGRYYSFDRSTDAKVFANMCDYLDKVHQVKYLNKETISTVFPNNKSAHAWFSDYDNSWGRKHNDTYKNTSQFRDNLRNLKYYRK